jgi:hypothetical protein
VAELEPQQLELTLLLEEQADKIQVRLGLLQSAVEAAAELQEVPQATDLLEVAVVEVLDMEAHETQAWELLHKAIKVDKGLTMQTNIKVVVAVVLDSQDVKP